MATKLSLFSKARTASQTAFLMAILTLLSKICGFLREMIMANYFGTSYIADAYVMAIAIPSIIFAGIFSAVATAFMPIFSQKIENEGESSSNKFTSEVITILIIISMASMALGMLFPDWIVAIFANGFQGETARLTVFFIRITFIYILFISTSNLLDAFLQYKGVFLMPIISGYIQNAVVIAVIVLSARYNHYFLVFGWLIAHIIRLLIVARIARGKNFRYTFNLKLNQTLIKIMPLAIPVFIGSSVSQIGMFVDKMLASGLKEGSIAALNYGYLLVGMIGGVTIAVLTTMTYPKLTQANSLDNIARFNEILCKGVKIALMIAVPFSLGALAFSNQVVQVVYERGSFNVAATLLTSSAFFYYAIGLTFTSINTLFTQVFYSNHNTKTPVLIGAIAVTIDIIFNFILIGPMKHNGLALSTSIGSIIQMILLYTLLNRRYPKIKSVTDKTEIIKIIFSAVASVGLAFLSYRGIQDLILMPRMVLFLIAVIIAGVVYVLLLKVFKIEEVDLIKQIVSRKNKV